MSEMMEAARKVVDAERHMGVMQQRMANAPKKEPTAERDQRRREWSRTLDAGELAHDAFTQALPDVPISVLARLLASGAVTESQVIAAAKEVT